MTYVILILGLLFLMSGLIAGVVLDRPEKQAAPSKRFWSRSYIFFLILVLGISALLSVSGFLEERVAVNAYRALFDLFTLVLAGALISGLILVFQRRRFILSYGLCVCGAFLTFGEFLGR